MDLDLPALESSFDLIAPYPVVAEVLIASMAEIAGDACRPEHERARAHALGLVADAMLDGAASAQLEAAA